MIEFSLRAKYLLMVKKPLLESVPVVCHYWGALICHIVEKCTMAQIYCVYNFSNFLHLPLIANVNHGHGSVVSMGLKKTKLNRG